MRNGQLKPGYNVQAATTNQVVDFALYSNLTDFRTILKSMKVIDKFQNIVADAGYDSELNYYVLEDKNCYIPYTCYEKIQEYLI